MGCCATTHEGLADLEVIVEKCDPPPNLRLKDSFLDVSLASQPGLESSGDEMPEPLFFVYSGKKPNCADLEKHLRRNQRSFTLTATNQTEAWERTGESSTKHIRAASMSKSPFSDGRGEDVSTNASIKTSFNDRFLTSK